MFKWCFKLYTWKSLKNVRGINNRRRRDVLYRRPTTQVSPRLNTIVRYSVCNRSGYSATYHHDRPTRNDVSRDRHVTTNVTGFASRPFRVERKHYNGRANHCENRTYAACIVSRENRYERWSCRKRRRRRDVTNAYNVSVDGAADHTLCAAAAVWKVCRKGFGFFF